MIASNLRIKWQVTYFQFCLRELTTAWKFRHETASCNILSHWHWSRSPLDFYASQEIPLKKTRLFTSSGVPVPWDLPYRGLETRNYVLISTSLWAAGFTSSEAHNHFKGCSLPEMATVEPLQFQRQVDRKQSEFCPQSERTERINIPKPTTWLQLMFVWQTQIL